MLAGCRPEPPTQRPALQVVIGMLALLLLFLLLLMVVMVVMVVLVSLPVLCVRCRPLLKEGRLPVWQLRRVASPSTPLPERFLRALLSALQSSESSGRGPGVWPGPWCSG